MSEDLHSSCGCIGVTSGGEPGHYNPPGLPDVRYRAGVHATFKQRMLHTFASRAGLNQLTTRDDDDPIVALSDAWASVLDVLTFYNERIANEGYLQTATERRSVLELSHEVGYEVNPGVAATTVLAFQLENAQGSPESVRLDTGTRTQSIPGQNELAQTFETTESIVAHSTWNAIAPLTASPLSVSNGLQDFYVKGVANDLKSGDSVLLVGKERLEDPISDRWHVRKVASVTTDAPNKRTHVVLDRPMGDWSRSVPYYDPKLYALRQRAALFGHNAIDFYSLPQIVRDGYGKNATNFSNFTIEGVAGGSLAGTGLLAEYFSNGTLTGTPIKQLSGNLSYLWSPLGSDFSPTGNNSVFSLRLTGWIEAPVDGSYTFTTEAAGGVRMWVGGVALVDAFGDRNRVVHSNVVGMTANARSSIRIEYTSLAAAPMLYVTWTPPNSAATPIPLNRLYPPSQYVVQLDAAYPKLLQDSWLVLNTADSQALYRVKKTSEDARAMFQLSGKTTRVVMEGTPITPDFNVRLRETSVLAQSDLLEWADQPVTYAVSGTAVQLQGRVDGLMPGRLLSFSGVDDATGKPVSEIIQLGSTYVSDDYTMFYFNNSLKYTYRRSSLAINANVAPAAHGETKVELLGSGNAQKRLQSFVLKNKPLTHLPASTATGVQSTLEIRVDGLLWNEVPTLLEAGPTDQVYTTSINDENEVTVRFGDGIHGSRVPSGSGNIVARYRVGSGTAGLLKAGQISLLLSRPLGLKSVSNPLPTEGAADAESRDEARRNAPLRVLALDRIVSLRDYEDFAQAFAGVGRARATVLQDGENKLIHLTLASATGGAIPEDSLLRKNLARAIETHRDQTATLVLASRELREFYIGASILVDEPRYVRAAVYENVTSVLRSAFGWQKREFSQMVLRGEVIAVMQSVPGVVAVHLKAFSADNYYDLVDGIPALPARWDYGQQGAFIAPAQLVTIKSDGIQLSEMTKP